MECPDCYGHADVGVEDGVEDVAPIELQVIPCLARRCRRGRRRGRRGHSDCGVNAPMGARRCRRGRRRGRLGEHHAGRHRAGARRCRRGRRRGRRQCARAARRRVHVHADVGVEDGVEDAALRFAASSLSGCTPMSAWKTAWKTCLLDGVRGPVVPARRCRRGRRRGRRLPSVPSATSLSRHADVGVEDGVEDGRNSSPVSRGRWTRRCRRGRRRGRLSPRVLPSARASLTPMSAWKTAWKTEDPPGLAHLAVIHADVGVEDGVEDRPDLDRLPREDPHADVGVEDGVEDPAIGREDRPGPPGTPMSAWKTAWKTESDRGLSRPPPDTPMSAWKTAWKTTTRTCRPRRIRCDTPMSAWKTAWKTRRRSGRRRWRRHTPMSAWKTAWKTPSRS